MKKYYSTPRIRTIDLSSEPVMLQASMNSEEKPFNPGNRNTSGQGSASIWDNWND